MKFIVRSVECPSKLKQDKKLKGVFNFSVKMVDFIFKELLFFLIKCIKIEVVDLVTTNIITYCEIFFQF